MHSRIKWFLVLLVVGIAGVAVAQNVANYKEQGGARWVVGGSLDVATGGDLDIESGGALKFAGTSITSTAAEINALDGVAGNTGLILGNSETINAGTDATFDFTRDDAGIVTMTCSDDDATAGCTYDAGGASPIVIGSSDVTVVTVTTDVGSVTIDGDVTIPVLSNGGNADAQNEFVGIPKIGGFSLGTMVDGTGQTIGPAVFIDETPAGEWTATANITASTDSSVYRKGTASLKLLMGATPADTNGADNPLGGGDQDWSADESFGLWHRCDTTTTAGDFDLSIMDNATPTLVDIPALATADKWTWLEVDVSGVADGDKDVITDLGIHLSAAGAAALGAASCYFDYAVKWDGADEDALGLDVYEDGVLSIFTLITNTGSARTPLLLVEGTDYFVHYETGNDFIVTITDQSAKSGWGMAAQE